MFAQLGNIVFKNLKGFTDYSSNESAIYGEHALLDGKPRLQFTGRGLKEVSLSMRLHAEFCNPLNELEKIKTYRNEGEVLKLLWGNGNLEGKFVITEIYETVEDADPEGNIFSYTVQCSLKEYVAPNDLQIEQQKNRNNATATGNKKPVTKKKVNNDRCEKLITELVTKIDNHAKSINVTVQQKGMVSLITVPNRNLVLQNLSAIKILDENLIVHCDDPNSCAHPIPDIKYRAEQIFNSQHNFTIAARDYQQHKIDSENQILQATVRNLRTAIYPLTQKTITRK